MEFVLRQQVGHLTWPTEPRLHDDPQNANGGNSDNEHFTDIGTKPLSTTSTETCNSYNMLKLTELLCRIDPKPKYMDYFENVLYNHILGSQDEQGHKTY